jgi:hypothetical protein
MSRPTTTSIESAPVVVGMRARWISGQSTMNVNITFGAHSLEDALALIKGATDAAPLFRASLEEEQS